MGRQTKSKKPVGPVPNFVGKGKVTPVQVAFIVDRYLADNNFSRTRALFRSEASSLLTKASVHEAPSSLLTLNMMLDEYISLKEQKVMLDHFMSQLEMENMRMLSLSHGVQGLLKAYNWPPPSSVVVSPSGNPAFETPISATGSIPDGSGNQDPANNNHALNSHNSRKRKSYNVVPDVSEPTKKSCASTSRGGIVHVSSPQDNINATSTSRQVILSGSPVQGSTVVKNLFNSSSDSPNSNTSGVQTPQRSMSSHSEKSAVNNNSLETTPTNCTIISSKRIIVNSPAKQYSIERKRCSFTSPSKTNLVKGRLDFDTTDLPVIAENTSPDFCTTSESDKDGDLFDIDFESLGPDFSLSELLHDFGLDCDVVGHEAFGASTVPPTGSPYELNNEGDYRVSQDMIEQNLTTKASDSITSVRSITQCIQITSPVKRAKNM